MRRRLIRSARVNLFGWTAIVLLCLAGAALGYGGSRLIGLPGAPGAVLGAAAVLSGLLVIDRRRYARLNWRTSRRRGLERPSG
jgi:hypothetical protein